MRHGFGSLLALLLLASFLQTAQATTTPDEDPDGAASRDVIGCEKCIKAQKDRMRTLESERAVNAKVTQMMNTDQAAPALPGDSTVSN